MDARSRSELRRQTLVRDKHVVKRLHKILRHDWEHSHPLDLSDEGLLADLEDRIEGSAEILGLSRS